MEREGSYMICSIGYVDSSWALYVPKQLVRDVAEIMKAREDGRSND